MKNILFLFAAGLAILFTSCKKDNTYEEPKTPQTMEELSVPATFDWKTTKEIQLNLQAGSNGIVEVTNIQNVVYQKAFLSSQQSYTMNLTVPTYETKIKVKHMGQEAVLDLTGNSLTYAFQ